MNLVEVPFINTHYFTNKNVLVKPINKYYNTICPDIINNIINSNVIHKNITLQNYYNLHFTLINNNIIDNHKTLYNHILFDNIKMFQKLENSKYDIYDWLKQYWDTPFLISNPVFISTNDSNIKYCFSNIKCTSIELNNSNIDEEYNQIITNGCFSIGNGLIIGLYFVSYGFWKEKDFINAILKLIDQKILRSLFSNNKNHSLYFFTSLKGYWSELFNIYPHQIIDNIFKYTFIFNSPNIYKFIYTLSNIEDNLIINNNIFDNEIYITSIFSYIKTKHQYDFFKNTTNLIKSYRDPLPQNLYNSVNNFTFNYYYRIDNIINSKKLYRYFINCNKSELKVLLFQKCEQINIDSILFNITKTICYLYKKYNKYKRNRLENIWRKINVIYYNKIIKILKYYFTYTILHKNNNSFIPIKLFKINIFRNNNFSYFKPFLIDIYIDNEIPYFLRKVDEKENNITYETSWKDIFKYMDDNYNKSEYKLCIEKKISRKLYYIYKITNNTENASYSYVNEIMKYFYYWDNKDELWK